jgi:hypothetical protein
MTNNNVGITQPRPISLEDVQRIIGAMSLEIEMLRRENALLRLELESKAEASKE